MTANKGEPGTWLLSSDEGTEAGERSLGRRPAGGPRSTRSRWILRAAIALVVVALLFYGAGGWYFSTQLGNDAFVVTEREPAKFEVEVVAIDDETVTLSAAAGEEPTLATPGVTGFHHGGGRLQLGAVLTFEEGDTADLVTRRYEVLTGAAPDEGDLGDLDSWLFPDDPTHLFPAARSVQFDSELGPLDAWFVPGEGDVWVIVVHGRRVTRRETLRLMSTVDARPMLSISYRNDDGQPADPSGFYRYGVTEWRDVEAAVAHALEQGADRVVLGGLSTGAALSLAFMYRSHLADRVVGLVFDAPNIDFGRTVDFGASQRRLPLVGLPVPQSLTTVAKLVGSWRYGVNWSEVDYIDDIDRIEVPMLVFHGTEDTTVPVDVSRRLAAARPDLVTLRVVAGAEHVQAWNGDPDAYEAAVRQFLAHSS